MDIAGVAEARAALSTALVDGEGRLVVDVTDLAFIDASGLQVLVSAAKQAAQCGGWLCLVGARDLLRRMLRILRLAAVLPVHDTVQAALAANGRAAGQLLRQGSDG
jgi:anti-anti-sigma factor